MKRLLVLWAFLSMFVSFAAVAATYQVSFNWTDPTSYNPGDDPIYEAKYRVNNGAETPAQNLTTPGGSVVVTANPGNPIDVAARVCNLGLCSAWTSWVTATAVWPATQPETQTGLSVNVVITTGP